MTTYTVRPGDTLWAIANRNSSTVSDLASRNDIRNPALLSVGQKIVLPGSGSGEASSTPALAVPSQDLRRGMTGPAVKQLQSALTQLGYLTSAQMATGPGTFGPQTESALKRFQSSHGLSATGAYDSVTRAALAQASGHAPATPAPATTSTSTPAPAATTSTPAPASSQSSFQESFPIPSRDLQRGMSGTAVQQLQSALVKVGCMTSAQMATGPGTFGPLTETSLKRFQSDHGVPATGHYGPMTRTALARAGGQVAQPTTPSVSPSGLSGPEALAIAAKYLGRHADELKRDNSDAVGKAMQDWVPGNVNCANFISGVLVAAGQIKNDQRSASVYGVIDNLRNDPFWNPVSLPTAQPGDVIAFETTGGQHIEMVARRDESGLTMIGSNNILRDGTQAVSYDLYEGNELIALMRYGP
ncbi:MAG: peptidoglycan-binding protein [Deltaproteobacteria bacterium]|nr:peptidoglycan-binding protein [Deltaproteobacteria bacterium]